MKLIILYFFPKVTLVDEQYFDIFMWINMAIGVYLEKYITDRQTSHVVEVPVESTGLGLHWYWFLIEWLVFPL